MSQYKVKPVNAPVNCVVEVPGSKSMTNRGLLMAAMSDGECQLNGVLFSDDSRHFLSSLISLGYVIEANEVEKYVVLCGHGRKIPKKNAVINVGSAGTAARFLTAMLAISDGEYTIECSDQMKKRPMKPLFDALTSIGAEFTYLEQEGHLPAKVKGASYGGKVPGTQVDIDISESTQFLSALMMIAPALDKGLNIRVTSEKKTGSYIRITMAMMKNYGCQVAYEDGEYLVNAHQSYMAGIYQIEPDVSAACYFYAAAAITGGSVLVRNVHSISMQGDMKFLSVLESMGCTIKHEPAGIRVDGPENGRLKGIEVDMNDFSDQTMTLAAVAVYAAGETYIKNIGHIRLQESDRINAVATELRSMGIEVEEGQDYLRITPGIPEATVVKTYNDHRMAMAFALIGLKTEGIIIDEYKCCGKTFENYFEVMDNIIRSTNS